MAMFVDGIPVAGGIPGVGIPKGGTDGQLLAKDGEKNYHGRWASPGDVALLPPKGYTGSPVTIPTRATDILAPSWTGKTTVTGTPSPDNPATITGVPFAATATGPDGQSRSMDLGITGYSLPDGAADSYDGKTGVVVRQIGKYEFTGNETFTNEELSTVYRFESASLTLRAKTGRPGYSTYFTYESIWNGDFEHIHVGGASVHFYLKKSRGITTNEQVKSWLAAQAAAGTPVTVYYALAQPAAYNCKADLQAFDGQTTVTGATTVEVIEGRIDRLAGYAYYEVVQVRQNLFDNPNFQINQRGLKEYGGTAETYGIDRWLTQENVKINLSENGIELIPTSTNTKNTGFVQRKEKDSLRIGEIYTFSVFAPPNVIALTFLYDGQNHGYKTHFPGKTYQYIEVYMGAHYINFGIINRAGLNGENILLACAKLEQGSTQTTARKVGGQWVLNAPPPDPTLELLKCQRYQLSVLDPLITGQSYIFKGKASDTSKFYGVLPTPVPMRTTPRVITDCSESTPYTAFGIVSSGYSQKIQITEIGAYSKMQNGVVLFATGSNIVRGNDYQVYIEKTNTHQFLLDANL